MHPSLNELLGIVLSKCEQSPLASTSQNEHEARLITRPLTELSGNQPGQFRRPVNRNSFLLACLDVTEESPIEHLIVGYGRRYGSTTKVSAAHHVSGESAKVSIPPHIQ